MTTEQEGFDYSNLPDVELTEAAVLAEAVRNNRFDARACHQHVVEHFGAERMARNYLRMYERVLAGDVSKRSANPLKPATKAFTAMASYQNQFTDWVQKS